MVVDPVAKNVQVILAAVERGDLDCADQRQRATGRAGGSEGLVEAADRVVITEREQLDTGLVGAGDQLSWAQFAIRGG